VMEFGGRPRQITSDTYFKVDPTWSHDGRSIAYSSDKMGTQDIYIIEVATGRERRVTSLPGAEVSAAFSPDDSMLAFQDQTGATFTLRLDTGEGQPGIDSLFAPSRPTRSGDGRHIMLAPLKHYTTRVREETR